MKNTKKKVMIILIVMLIVIIALVGAVAAMVFTGNLALTNKQKLAKGLKDLTSRLGEVSIVQDTSAYDKMSTTPFKLDTTITASIDKLEIEGAEQAEEVLTELKEIVGETTITNTLQADWKNNIVNESLKLEMSDVVEKISLDLEYNQDQVALRSKELNEKYITFTKNDVVLNEQYEELAEVFTTFEQMCDTASISDWGLTEEERLHFTQTYSGIFSKYLTDDIITSEKATINVDGVDKACSVISFTFDKKQIQEIVGEYLQILENDATGKSIILSEIQVLEKDFTEEDLIENIKDIRNSLEELNDNIQIKVSVCGTNFETYGLGIEVFDEETTKLSIILGNETMNVSLNVDEQEVAEAIIKTNEVNIDISGEELESTINIKKEGTANKVTVSMIQPEEATNISITIINEQVSNTEIENTERTTINFGIELDENVIEFGINVESKLQYVDTVTSTNLNDENSLDLVTDTTGLQQYITDLATKGQAILQTAGQNSVIVNTLINAYAQMMIVGEASDITEDVSELTSQQAVQTFNNQFSIYEGTIKGSAIKSLLQTIARNNSMGTKQITFILVENDAIALNTNDSTQITNVIDKIINSESYIVAIAEYDDEGYIKTIAMKKK